MKNLTLFFLGLLSPTMAQMAPQPLPQVEHLQGQNYLFSWEGVPGRMYFIQTSSSLAANEFDWEFAPDIRVGTGSQIEMGFQANAAHFEFFRLVYNDLSEGEDANLKDNDDDGFTNLEEAIANTDPNNAQSYPGSSGSTGGGNSGGSSGSGTTWNHPWEYKLTYNVEGSTISEDFINPYNDVGLYDYDLELGYETEILFENIEGDNKVTFLQLESDLSSSSSSNAWKVEGLVELSEQHPNWSYDDDPQGTGAVGLLLPVEIVPDWNRDGKITGADRGQISVDNPFRWWINNDDDKQDEEIKDNGVDAPIVGTPPAFVIKDWFNNQVDGMRDLVDFFPLHLDLKGLLGTLPSDEYSYFVKHADGALKFYEETETVLDAAPDNEGPAAYLRNLTKARAVKTKTLKHASSSGVQLSDEILEAFEDGKGVLICEATKKTDKPVILEIKKSDGTSIAEIEFPVKFSEVEDMYRHGNMRNTTGGSGGLRTQLQDPGDPYPDELTNGKYFVFLHGFNVGPDAARGWHAEIFKRLHQMGSRNRFTGISWHGDVAPDYHEAVKNAFLTSKALPAWLQVGGAKITIAAHSLGNMVVSNAIEHEDHNGTAFTPETYFMINAATPIEAYDASQTTGADGTIMAPRMTENAWKPYDRRLYASDWHKLFAAPDGREKLRWPNRFANRVPQLAYNFYSTGEDVVENADASESFIGNAATELFNGFVRHAWTQNEIMKGHPLAALITKDTHAGWRFDEEWDIGDRTRTPAEASILTNQQLRRDSFFRFFKYVDLYDESKGSAEANKKQVQHELLSAAIPAMSYAAAANPIEEIERKGNANFNMMNKKNGGWPRPTGDWQHSDFRDVAFSYVVPMFQEMINQGKLDE